MLVCDVFSLMSNKLQYLVILGTTDTFQLSKGNLWEINLNTHCHFSEIHTLGFILNSQLQFFISSCSLDDSTWKSHHVKLTFSKIQLTLFPRLAPLVYRDPFLSEVPFFSPCSETLPASLIILSPWSWKLMNCYLDNLSGRLLPPHQVDCCSLCPTSNNTSLPSCSSLALLPDETYHPQAQLCWTHCFSDLCIYLSAPFSLTRQVGPSLSDLYRLGHLMLPWAAAPKSGPSPGPGTALPGSFSVCPDPESRCDHERTCRAYPVPSSWEMLSK